MSIEWKDPRKEIPNKDCDVSMKIETDISFIGMNNKIIDEGVKEISIIEGSFNKETKEFCYDCPTTYACEDYDVFIAHSENDFCFENAPRKLLTYKISKPKDKDTK